MPSPRDAGQPATAGTPVYVALISRSREWIDRTGALLEQHGYRLAHNGDSPQVGSLPHCGLPAVIVVDGMPDGPDSEPHVRPRAAHVPVLAVLDAAPDPAAWARASGPLSDWVLRTCAPAELAARVACLLERQGASRAVGPRLPADARFFSLVIHDLRTPLNVIGLSLRMINQAVPKGDLELDEDLRFVEENFKQIERMLVQLSDFFRLYEGSDPLYNTEFSPRNLLDELLESRAAKPGPKNVTVRTDVRGTCPRSVILDQTRARLALQYALSNAVAAAGDGSVVVTLRGEPGRWITEIATDRPAPGSVHPTELHSHVYERLCGTAAERRGMDLAIAARVTELFDGRARLDVTPSGTTLVLDWPERLESAFA